MVDGPSVNRHHWVPRAYGGRAWATLHVICHKKIHSVLSDRDLADGYGTAKALRQHPEIAAFIKWVRRRPATYTGRHRPPRRS